MKDSIKKAIEEYQCPGCVCGMDITCFESLDEGVGCSKHVAGTIVSGGIGSIFLGMPRGFDRLGPYLENTQTKLRIFTSIVGNGWDYSKYNIPVWKYKNKNGHVFIRGLSPRTNWSFMHIFLEDCINRISCLEITDTDIEEMD